MDDKYFLGINRGDILDIYFGTSVIHGAVVENVRNNIIYAKTKDGNDIMVKNFDYIHKIKGD